MHRSRPDQPGLSRRRRGRGFEYLDASGRRIDTPATVARIRELAIPPAWTDVWICRSPSGHLQAVGTDAAGRRQYLYHPDWIASGDAAKRQRMEAFALALPVARSAATAALRHRALTADRVLAVAFRILDQASVRVGSEQYAVRYATHGLATLRRDHVHVRGGTVVCFDFPGKQSRRIAIELSDQPLARAVQQLLRRRDDGDPRLLAWRSDRATSWQHMSSADLNRGIQRLTGGPFTAKDFRTWNATVLMAVELVRAEQDTSWSGRRLTKEAVGRVADHLGNTPAVATRSYIDPRVSELYADGVRLPLELATLPAPAGRLVAPQAEAAVLEMLRHPVRATRLFARIERSDNPVVVANEVLLRPVTQPTEAVSA